ncbi:hypothetical protein [Pedobacter sp. GR22-6]|uniref:hypothetical protein n=1 Tax=Pedobacter sp. GR22-6 TaxID=3127957 RepID=UPI00307DE423
MFKKIHSNRPPGVTLLSELKKEFAQLSTSVYATLLIFLQRRPRFVFATMILLMLSSMVLSFYVLRPGITITAGQKPSVVRPISDGFGEIVRQGDALRRTIAIKQEIEQMLAKDSLSGADSLRMSLAIDELKRLSDSQNLNPNPK